jgi:SecD/SecF fusion protein
VEKRKRWHFFLIVIAIVLTVYNILPTIFYYAHPLKNPIDEKRAVHVAQSIGTRVNSLRKRCCCMGGIFLPPSTN